MLNAPESSFIAVVVAIVLGLFLGRILKALRVVWTRINGVVGTIIVGLRAIGIFFAINIQCQAKRKFFSIPIDRPLFPVPAAPLPPMPRPILFVWPSQGNSQSPAVTSPTPGKCQVISGQGLGCRDVP